MKKTSFKVPLRIFWIQNRQSFFPQNTNDRPRHKLPLTHHHHGHLHKNIPKTRQEKKTKSYLPQELSSPDSYSFINHNQNTSQTKYLHNRDDKKNPKKEKYPPFQLPKQKHDAKIVPEHTRPTESRCQKF